MTGHAAALLREFKVPSVFEMSGAFDLVRPGEAVSLDSARPALYAGALWPGRREGRAPETRRPARDATRSTAGCWCSTCSTPPP